MGESKDKKILKEVDFVKYFSFSPLILIFPLNFKF